MIDGIVAARRVAEDEQAFNEFVHELQAIAIATDCTVFMLTSARGVHITPEHTMVDGIIELFDQLSGWAAESSLQVVKFRGSAFYAGDTPSRSPATASLFTPALRRYWLSLHA